MPSSVRPLLAGLAVLAVTALGGCSSDKPYVLSDYLSNQKGEVQICYSSSNSTPQQVAAVAEDVCNRYHRTAKLWLTQPGQCNLATPNISTFYCVARPGETPPPFNTKKAPLRHDSDDFKN